MLINHKYKFIFLKPSRVGGSSLQVGLLRSFGYADVGYADDPLVGREILGLKHKRVRLDSHAHLDEILQMYPEASNYTLISIYRDSWAKYESAKRWAKHWCRAEEECNAAAKKAIEHDSYLENLTGIVWLSSRHLQMDYEDLCESYGVRSFKLPHLRKSNDDKDSYNGLFGRR